MSARLLLVSYHFGPGCDTGGLRWNAMAEHLASAGWHVDVIAAARLGMDEPYDFRPGVHVRPVPVPTGLDRAVKAIANIKRGIAGRHRGGSAATDQPGESGPPSPAGPPRVRGAGARLYSELMGNLDVVTQWRSEAGWARRAARAGLEIARRNGAPVVVAVSSPPLTTQLAGVRLARSLGVPYLADFRDPWGFKHPDAVQSRLLDRALSARAQRQVFGAASLVVCNTARAAEAATLHNPRLAVRAVAVPNGYDLRDRIGRPDPAAFRVAFVGWLYDFMDPAPLLEACARLRERERLESLRVEFVGTDPAPRGVSLRARARDLGLEPYFEHRPRVSREEALRIQDRAAVQVVFDALGPLQVPMKFYDGVQMYGDLLLIGQQDSALGDAGAKVGLSVCSPADPAALDAALARGLARWRAGDYARPLDQDGSFSRVKTSERMRELLERLSGAPPGGRAAAAASRSPA